MMFFLRNFQGHLGHQYQQFDSGRVSRGPHERFQLGETGRTFSHSVGQNSDTWPQLIAKKTGKHYLVTCLGGRRNRLGKQLVHLYCSAQDVKKKSRLS